MGIMYIIKRKILVTLNVYYWLPDYQNILQQFVWQTLDTKPKYPRVHKFLNYWHNNIDAIVNEVQICENERNT
tara:strand:+ start:941 stop:1159 length:219 start_codon:yes stop_codon:yes gene_type:complete